jgi:threonine/homoserine/homoserine lactone efflux protein
VIATRTLAAFADGSQLVTNDFALPWWAWLCIAIVVLGVTMVFVTFALIVRTERARKRAAQRDG